MFTILNEQRESSLSNARAEGESLWLDIAAMWRYMGNPVAHDASATTWVFGTGADQRAQTLASLDAPDFVLPDLQGQPHSQPHYSGKKVLLTTWASW